MVATKVSSQPAATPSTAGGSGRLASQIIARNSAMESEAAQWKIRWDECARFIQQRKGDILTRNTPGQQQMQHIYDTTAEEALMVFAAGLLSSLVPPGERWFRFEPKNKKRASPVLIRWLDEVSEICAEAIYSSNFYLAIHEDFIDSGCFGTSVIYIEEGKKFLMNFVNIPVGTFVFSENNEGIVDTVYRKWKWTARQAEQQWGFDNLGENIQKALTSQNAADADRLFTFIHAVYPRREGEFRIGLTAGPTRPIASIYVCVEDQKVILEDGCYEMPFIASRLLRSNNEVYGRGPGTQAMPEIKTLNSMERDLLTAVEKLVNPPWLLPDDASYQPDGRARGITYYDSTNPNNKPEQLELKNQVDLGEQKTEQKRKRVRNAFFNDMFQMLSGMDEQKREKTAYEVQQMVAERLVLFSPIFARLVQEKLNPLLQRVFGIMMRSGRLPPFPVGLVDGADYEIVYVSKIALAINAVKTQNLATAVQIITGLQPLDGSVAFLLDCRKAGRDGLRSTGTPSDWIRSDDEVDQMWQAQQKQMQMQQAAAMAESASKSVGNLGPGAQEKAAQALPG